MTGNIKERIDTGAAGWCGLVVLSFVIVAAVWPAVAESMLSAAFTFLTGNFGWLVLLLVAFFVVFLLYMMLGRYGDVRLGGDDERPEYSRMSWFFMLFAAGMGIGLMFYGTAEPLSHYLTPPEGAGRTAAAAGAAMRHAFMHWGIHPWAIYGVVGLALAYFQFRKKWPALFSSCLIPLIGEKRASGRLGSLLNTFAAITTVFGVASSLGFGVIQINAGLSYLFGIPFNNTVKVILIIVMTALFILSSVSGISRAMKALSNINLFLIGALLAFVFIVGPSRFLINFFTDTLGAYLAMVVQTSLWTDAFNTTGGWVNGWTVFYWVWWMSWGPFVGAFIARISKGRTIREFVIGALLCPTLLCFLVMTIFGGTAIHFDRAGITGIAGALNQDISYALFALLAQLPLPTLTSLVGMALVSIFFITSANSSTYVCAMLSSYGVQVPPVSLRVFWGIAEALAALALLVTGGLAALKAGAIIISFPFMIIIVLMIVSLTRALEEERRAAKTA